MNTVVKKSENVVALKNEDTFDKDLGKLGEAAQELSGGMVGSPLKFVKGVWKWRKPGNADFVPIGKLEQFVVDPLSYQRGWLKWVDKQLKARFMGRPIDDHPFPVRERMPDLELAADKETDPWRETHTIVMRNVGAEGEPNLKGELFTYSTSSWGGRKALGKLLKTFRDNARKHAGEFPVVYLGSVDRPGPKGDYAAPTLEVVTWCPFGDSAAPPGRPLSAIPAAIQHLSDMRGDGDGAEPGSFEKDPEDEIPF